MFGILRRGVHRHAPSLTALLVVAPLWTISPVACAEEANRMPPPPGSRVDPTAPAAVNGAVQLDDSFQDTTPLPGERPLPGEDFNGRFGQDAMELRTNGAAANYGKPVLKKPGQKPPRKTASPPLQTLAPYPTSAEARRAAKQERAPPPSDPAYIAPSPTTAALPPLPAKPRPKIEEEPFAPVGIDAGLLRIKPYSERELGYSDNPNLTSKPVRGSAFARKELGVAAASDWSNHAFTGDLRLGYNDYFNAHEADAPDGQGKFLARIDVARDLKINVDGKFSLTTQSSSSPNINNGGASTALSTRPIVAVYGGGLAVVKTFNRLELSLRGSAERDDWADAHFADGSVQQLSRDSYNDYGLTGRAAYEVTPGVKPFVEAALDTRARDSATDSSGYMRDSNGVMARIGSTFELSRLLTGDIDVGYGERVYRDPRLPHLRGPLFDSSLLWTVTPLTKVTLRGATSLDETTIAASPGVITQIGSLEISHALLRNLTLTATGSIQDSHYQVANINQTLYQTGLQAEYSLTRSVVIKGSFTHQRMVTNQAGTDYTANIVMVGLRLQR